MFDMYGGWMLDIKHIISYQTAKPYMRNVINVVVGDCKYT